MKPNDKNSEHAILSGMMLDEESTAKAIELVNADDFYTNTNKLLFSAMVEMFGSNIPVDILTLSDKLKESKILESVGGILFLNELSDMVYTNANMEHHANILIKKRLARDILDISKRTINRIENDEPIGEVLDNTREKLMNIDNNKNTHDYSSIQAVTKTIRQTEKIITSGKPVGLKTYITDLDNYIIMKAGNLITIGAKKGCGKTMLADQIGFQNVLYDKKVCGFLIVEGVGGGCLNLH